VDPWRVDDPAARHRAGLLAMMLPRHSASGWTRLLLAGRGRSVLWYGAHPRAAQCCTLKSTRLSQAWDRHTPAHPGALPQECQPN